MRRSLQGVLSLAVVLWLFGCSARSGGPVAVGGVAPQGLAVGEVTESSAVLWLRCVGQQRVEVAVEGKGAPRRLRFALGRDNDWTVRAPLRGLRPATAYSVAVDCGGVVRGWFRTAPRADAAVAVRIAFGGDVGGQNVCRDVEKGYGIFARVAATEPDVFVGLGDFIYADNHCEAVGRYGNSQVPGPGVAFDLAGFRAHWRYNRSDAAFRDFLARVPLIALWDDHEVRNDWGPRHVPESLHSPAMRAFVEYHPLAVVTESAPIFYRSFRWGRYAELFVLDNRQYRDRNDQPDGAGKSMLGAVQLAWLKDGLARSDATWKIVVSSVPLSIPTGAADARDGWANGGGETGFEREATEILRFAQSRRIRNLLWITTDVHFATGFRYTPFADDSEFVVYELVTGPLNAGVFAGRAVDPTFNPERLYYWAPPTPESIDSYENALGWFNFGLIEIDEAGDLRFSLIDGFGNVVEEQGLGVRN